MRMTRTSWTGIGLTPWALLALLNTGLSQRGYAKALTIMSLEPVLGEMEQNRGKFVRDSDLYYFTIFGTPGGTETWGWRVEGHHVSMNFGVRGGEVLADSPAFLGANPVRGSTVLMARLPHAGTASAYPVTLGYEMVSEVVEVGPEVSAVSVGDLVHTVSNDDAAAR